MCIQAKLVDFRVIYLDFSNLKFDKLQEEAGLYCGYRKLREIAVYCT